MEHSTIRIWVIVSQTLCGVGVLIFLANIVEIILLIKTRISWHNAQILLFSLALIDAAIGLATIISTTIFLYDLIGLRTLCVILAYVFYGNMCGSSFIVVLISVDRWVAVKWPLKYRTLITKRRLNAAILMAFVLSILILSLMTAVREVDKGYTAMFSIAGTILITETLLLVYLYCSVFVLYRRSAKAIVIVGKASNDMERNLKNHRIRTEQKIYQQNQGCKLSFLKLRFGSQGNETDSGEKFNETSMERSRVVQLSEREKRLLKFCIAIVVCFFLSFMPAAVLFFIAKSPWQHEFIHQSISMAFTVNSFCGSMWNPFLYFLHQFFGKRKSQ